VAVRDAYPISQGHTLVVPCKHVSTIYELTVMEQDVIWELVSEVRKRLLAALRPEGFNIGLNEGLAAGQTIMHVMFT
jgi:diadenosine tetraphosphate (Ap4A) HIT family hydrolase